MKSSKNFGRLTMAMIFTAIIVALLPITVRGHAERYPALANLPFKAGNVTSESSLKMQESSESMSATLETDAGLLFLPIVIAPDTLNPISPVLTPFDANLDDLVGPSSWAANYGKTPEIIVSSDGVELDVLAQFMILELPGTPCCYTSNPAQPDMRSPKHSQIFPFWIG